MAIAGYTQSDKILDVSRENKGTPGTSSQGIGFDRKNGEVILPAFGAGGQTNLVSAREILEKMLPALRIRLHRIEASPPNMSRVLRT
jgi:hypothetical protein